MKKLTFLFSALFLLSICSVQAQKCSKSTAAGTKSCCAKKATSTAASTSIYELNEASLEKAIAAAESMENIDYKQCKESGKVCFYETSTCAKSGKVSKTQVSYNPETATFVAYKAPTSCNKGTATAAEGKTCNKGTATAAAAGGKACCSKSKATAAKTCNKGTATATAAAEGKTCSKGTATATAAADKACCSKSKAAAGQYMIGTADTKAAVAAAQQMENIEYKACEKSNTVTFYQTSTCAKSGKVTSTKVAYDATSGSFAPVNAKANCSQKASCSKTCTKKTSASVQKVEAQPVQTAEKKYDVKYLPNEKVAADKMK